MRLVIGDTRSGVLARWKSVLGRRSEVQFLSLDPIELRKRTQCDAELIPGVLAHPRFGGRPIDGKSQVLRSGDPSFPKWIVTTPAGVFRLPHDPEALASLARDSGEPGSAVGDIRGAFEAIDAHNAVHPEEQIRSLCLHLEVLNTMDERAEEDADGLRCLLDGEAPF